MTYSMTGFGSCTMTSDYCSIKTEVKSVNSKYLDTRFRLPKIFNHIEMDLLKKVKETAVRGKVDVSVDIQFKKPVKIPKINHNMLNVYLSVLREIQMESEVLDDIRIDHLTQFEDIMEYTEDAETEKNVEIMVMESVDKALEELNQMRYSEGVNMLNDLKSRIANLKSSLEKIKDLKNQIYNFWYEKFKTRMKALEIEIQEERLIQEAGFYAEKSDITEEIVRIDSHLDMFLKTLDNEESSGKKLDFISQELHREYNTIGSKSNSSEITNHVVDAKSEVDKIREQVQNIV